MAQLNPIKLLLNQDTNVQPVASPAFSITKVLSTLAIIVTPLVTVVTEQIGKIDFTSTQLVALIVSVLAFLGIVSASDVIARAIASRPGSVLDVDPPIGATLVKEGPDTPVQIIGLRGVGESTEFLVSADKERLQWATRATLHIVGD